VIQRIGEALPFDAFYAASGVGKTGLTVTVDVFNPAGTQIVTGGSATETGGGFYRYTLSAGSVTTAGNYRAVFKTTDSTVDQKHQPALWVVGTSWVELLVGDSLQNLSDTVLTRMADARLPDIIAGAWNALLASYQEAGSMGEALYNATQGGGATAAEIWSYVTRTLTAVVSSVSYNGPVASAGNIEIVKGADYFNADGQALEWSSTGWPDLTGATIEFVAKTNRGAVQEFSKAGSVVTPTGTAVVRVELNATDTDSFTVGQNNYRFTVWATLVNGHTIPLVRDYMTVLED
jgi:hypothetical protein